MASTLWAAVDLTGTSSNVETALLVGIGLALGFVAFKLGKRVMARL